MKAVILLAKPGSSFHFGDYAPFGETFLDNTTTFTHSDTLFSALVNIHNQVWPEDTNAFIEQFSKGKIMLSSAMFCFRGKKKSLFFLPRPAMMKIESDTDLKELKHIEWVSTGVWEKGMISGQQGEKPLTAAKRFSCLESEWSLLSGDDPALLTAYEMNPVSRVKIHSRTREDTLYQQTNITLCGSPDVNVCYYFLAEYDELDTAAKDRLETVISLLPDTGLGGQRTTGCGFFEGIEWHENPLPDVMDDSYNVNLGILSPVRELQNCLAYRVMTRGGRRTETGQLKKILMIREGGLMNDKPRGQIADLSMEGNGSFLRYGMPVSWPVSKRVINL